MEDSKWIQQIAFPQERMIPKIRLDKNIIFREGPRGFPFVFPYIGIHASCVCQSYAVGKKSSSGKTLICFSFLSFINLFYSISTFLHSSTKVLYIFSASLYIHDQSEKWHTIGVPVLFAARRIRTRKWMFFRERIKGYFFLNNSIAGDGFLFRPYLGPALCNVMLNGDIQEDKTSIYGAELLLTSHSEEIKTCYQLQM